ncbi:MAG: GspE/PulE family protein [Negativicutes bacterium]|nr:GspE/PulE family protein [Negativicutes bacterium]
MPVWAAPSDRRQNTVDPSERRPVKKTAADDGSATEIVAKTFEQAVAARASDIHFEPLQSELRVRLRVDGVLRTVGSYSSDVASAVISRIKILSDLNIAERRIPQDGRFKQIIGDRDVDFRVSTLPTVLGEKIVVRVQDRAGAIFDLGKMGFSDFNQQLYQRLISRAHGMLLVTGPTGSGKSTTMYATINQLNCEGKNFVTVEDPVEFQIDGINQVNVNVAAGLTFAKALRAILRQDPNVVMIGEIRDRETADIALRAALTGHFVLSTVHANDAASVVTRLIDMGVEPFLVSTAVVGVVSQRLVRKICPECRQEYRLTGDDVQWELLSSFGQAEGTVLYRGAGCPSCSGTGYAGRIAIHEILPITDRLQKMICSNLLAADIMRAATEEGIMVPILRDGVNKALAGLTTVDEVLRMVSC